MRINDLQAQLRREATHDHLTGLANRRMFIDRLNMELTRAARYGRELSVAILDIDHFKAVNDTHGHDVGDTCLQKLARFLIGLVRSADLVARWGGEEFVVLLPETDAEHAFLAIDRFRNALPLDLAPPTSTAGRTTFSAGVSALRGRRLTGEELLKEADSALYSAKHAGRNRVHVADVDAAA
jgi:diguanylate cyclase (GGDEF)-like protein